VKLYRFGVLFRVMLLNAKACSFELKMRALKIDGLAP